MKTVQEAKDMVANLESEILQKLKGLESETGLKVVSLSFFDVDSAGRRKEQQVRVDVRIS